MQTGGLTLADIPKLVIYTLEYCPNCEVVKEYLKRNQIPFDERNMATAESLTELRINGVFVNEAPVLQGPGGFLTTRDLFSRGTLQEDRIRRCSEGS
jgi:glutaredoxin